MVCFKLELGSFAIAINYNWIKVDLPIPMSMIRRRMKGQTVAAH